LPNQKSDIRRIKAAVQIGSDGNGSHSIQKPYSVGPSAQPSRGLAREIAIYRIAYSLCSDEVGAPIQHAYFLESGLSSILNVLQNGKKR